MSIYIYIYAGEKEKKLLAACAVEGCKEMQVHPRKKKELYILLHIQTLRDNTDFLLVSSRELPLDSLRQLLSSWSTSLRDHLHKWTIISVNLKSNSDQSDEEKANI